MRELVDISGSQTVATPGLPTTTLVGGLLSQETNIGTVEQDEFVWIPELNINIGYSLTPSLDFSVGYSLLYVTDTVQPGTTIDTVIDPALLSDLDPLNGNRPQVILNQRDYWLQGLNFGLTGRF